MRGQWHEVKMAFAACYIAPKEERKHTGGRSPTTLASRVLHTHKRDVRRELHPPRPVVAWLRPTLMEKRNLADKSPLRGAEASYLLRLLRLKID